MENFKDLMKIKDKYKRLIECFPKEDLYREYYEKLTSEIEKIKSKLSGKVT
jgi:predicted  nucleic acid-binding Zn-ribbon protein